jgi:hypothetical protein
MAGAPHTIARWERRVVAEAQQQGVERHDDRDERQREQQRQRQPLAGDAGGPRAIAGAERMGGEGGQRRDDALQRDPDGDVEACPEPGGGERHGAQASHHDGVGEADRHLGEVRGGERRRDRERRAQFRADGGGGMHGLAHLLTRHAPRRRGIQ